MVLTIGLSALLRTRYISADAAVRAMNSFTVPYLGVLARHIHSFLPGQIYGYAGCLRQLNYGNTAPYNRNNCDYHDTQV